jgi:muconolactone delta-isomerase
MESVVDMVTTVPPGTSEDAVADIRTREAAHSAELLRRGCSVCGYHRGLRANGELGARSAPMTLTSWSKSSCRCRCGCGVMTPSRRFVAPE